MSENDLPTQYWHCLVQTGEEEPIIVNDLNRDKLFRTIVEPWHAGRPFTVDGKVLRSQSHIETIKIAQTGHQQSNYAAQHNQRMQAQGIGDFVTNRRQLPFDEGRDYTFELLFAGFEQPSVNEEIDLIERVCKRLRRSARILNNRSHKHKDNFNISDEYDVQDLLHATLRAYLKHSVQEDTLPKVAGAKSSRVDISIEDLGTLIEIKYTRGPNDQKKFFEELSQDLTLYPKWPHLKRLIFMIYNSDDLKDPEAFEKLNGVKNIDGKEFSLKVVLG